MELFCCSFLSPAEDQVFWMQAFGTITANCMTDKADTRISVFGFEVKGLIVALFALSPHPWPPSQLQPGSPCLENYWSVRLPLSFAFSRKKDFSRVVPEASWSERLCKHFMIVHVKGLNHETTWHTALLWPISGFCLNTSPRSTSPFSLHGSQLPWG